MAAEEAPGRRRRLRRIVGTVRFRITALATLLVAAVLVVTGVVLLRAQERLLTDSLDDTLAQRADDVEAILAEEVPDTLANRGSEDTLAQVVSPDGGIVVASENVEGDPPIAVPLPGEEREVIRTVDGLPIDDDSFRLLSRQVDTADGPAVLHVAATVDDVNDSTEILRTSLTIAIPTVVAVLAALLWWLVGRTLRPVEAIRREVADITGSDLHRRVPQPGGDDEIARLARTMNDMLGRVDQASARQQRFVADASHELRSPLTRIRSEIEVNIAHPDRADLEQTERSVLAETTAMQQLVADLLHLARSDTGSVIMTRVPVDLDDLVLREARRLRAGGRVQVDLSGVSAARVVGDRDQLTRAIRNLSDNASRHATTAVSYGLDQRDGHATLTVTDDGPGVPAEDRHHVFERFARLDDARSRDAGGTGLGLAITRDIIERHGGEIRLDTDYVDGARFAVRLPAEPDA